MSEKSDPCPLAHVPVSEQCLCGEEVKDGNNDFGEGTGGCKERKFMGDLLMVMCRPPVVFGYIC